MEYLPVVGLLGVSFGIGGANHSEVELPFAHVDVVSGQTTEGELVTVFGQPYEALQAFPQFLHLA